MSSFGAVYQELASGGVHDKVTTGATVESSNITLWRFVHMKHTAFALEPVQFSCNGQARFGGRDVKFTFPRQGDLVWHVYAKITLPGIVGVVGTPGDTVTIAQADAAPYWTNAIGQYLMQEVKLSIGGTVIDTLYDTYLFMWEELSGKPGKRLSEMIGKYDTVALRQATSKRSRTLHVPLPFYFTDSTGLALPLASLQFHQVNLEISFADRTKCYVIPDSDISDSITIYERPNGAKDSEIQAGDYSLTLLSDTSLTAMVEACYVYLDHDERSKFAHGQFEQITTEVQRNRKQVSSSAGNNGNTITESTADTRVDMELNFSHLVTEYIIAVRRQDKEDANQHFDFGGFFDDDADGGSGLTLDPIKEMTVLFNNSQRVQPRPGVFYRTVQPYQHHTNIPRSFIYVWCYAVDAEDPQPTGAANHSRIDRVNLDFKLDTRIFQDTTTAEIFVYARNRNLLRLRHGLATRKFG